MSFLNPGFPGARSASFGADASASSSPSSDMGPALVLGGIGVVFGLLVLKDLLTPDETPVGGRNVELIARVHEAQAAQARPVVASDPGANSYFAARVKNDNRREAQKARLEKWKSSL